MGVRIGRAWWEGFARAVAAVVLTMASVVVGTPGAGASCGMWEPWSSSETWSRSDLVFSAEVSPPETIGLVHRARIVRMKVREVFKGLVVDELVVSVGECGPPWPNGEDLVVGLGLADGGRLEPVGSMTVEQAKVLTGVAPPATSGDQAQSVVAVDLGPIDLVALDRFGRAAGFHVGGAEVTTVARCPGGRVLTSGHQIGTVHETTLELIDVSTMASVRSIPFSRSEPPAFLACNDFEGSDIAAFEWTDAAGGRLVRFDGTSTTVLGIRARAPFGKDASGNVVGWTNVFTSEIVRIDPHNGAEVRKHLMPSDLHGLLESTGPVHVGVDRTGSDIGDRRFAAVSDDGRFAAVIARENQVDDEVPPPKLVLFDLLGDVDPAVLSIWGDDEPDLLTWDGGNVVLHFSPTIEGQAREGRGLQVGGVARRSTIDAEGALRPLADQSVSPATGETPNPTPVRADELVVESAIIGDPPTVLGVPVRSGVSLPTPLTMMPSAATPRLPGTPPPHGGRPLPVPWVVDWTTVVVSAVALVILGALGTRVWQRILDRRRKGVARHGLRIRP